MTGLRTILPALRGISFGPRRWPNEPPSSKGRTFSQAAAKIRSSNIGRRIVSTLKPENMTIAGQETFDFSNLQNVRVTVRNVNLQIVFIRRAPFPPQTIGVLYFRYTPGSPLDSQLRIRLCESIEDFAQGSDLLVKADKPWNINLHRLQACGLPYMPLFDMIKEEFPVKHSNAPHGLSVVTLLPEEMVLASQAVLDLSGRKTFACKIYSGRPRGRSLVQFRYRSSASFPPNTRGVFYAMHNNQELRFRLCSTVKDFHVGPDLLLPNGKPWKYTTVHGIFLSGSTVTQTGKRQWVETLVPKNIISSGREVISKGSLSSFSIWVGNRDASGQLVRRKIRIRGIGAGKAFKGVFYYHHVPGDDEQSQLRFRLCPTTADFAAGEDVRGETGRIWNKSLSKLRKSTDYQPIFDLIRDEYFLVESGAGVLRSKNPLQPILSLTPRNLVAKKQQIIDVSGLHDVFLNVAPTNTVGKPKKMIQVEGPTSGADPSDSVAFPPDTVGVFYYKQSLTLPTQIGELRFRLCRDLALFDHSEDLTFPTGDPWYIDMQQLHLNEQYRSLWDILVREGLVEKDPYLEDPADPQLRSQDGASIVPNVTEPFALELSRDEHKFWLQLDTDDWVMLKIKGLFSSQEQGNNAYMGRVVARFEPYPEDVDDPSDTEPRPLLALRFLEVLAPIQQVSDEDYMRRPVPGQLHMVCPPNTDDAPGEYRPWGFRNSNPENREILLEFINNTVAKKL